MILVIYLLATTHLTAVAISIYLHRSLAHNSVKFNSYFAHVIRFYLWITTGIERKIFIGLHRLHHSTSDTEKDPSSPHNPKVKLYTRFAWKIGARTNSSNQEYLNKFSSNFKEDWLDKNIYCHTKLGFVILLIINLVLFDTAGIFLTAIQLLWLVIFSMVTLGLCHSNEVRHNTSDRSKNITSIGILFAGEELHHNHHLAIGEPFFSHNKNEFDVGFFYLTLLDKIGLVKLRTLSKLSLNK